ncbi:MAG: GntR family transcriptional regulator, partial [Pseudomonadota bacterium]
MTSDDLVEKAYSSFVNSFATELSSDKDMMLKAYTELKGWIFSQRIVPGQKLIYNDLANRLGMSKTPIIYALTRLESEG